MTQPGTSRGGLRRIVTPALIFSLALWAAVATWRAHTLDTEIMALHAEIAAQQTLFDAHTANLRRDAEARLASARAASDARLAAEKAAAALALDAAWRRAAQTARDVAAVATDRHDALAQSIANLRSHEAAIASTGARAAQAERDRDDLAAALAHLSGALGQTAADRDAALKSAAEADASLETLRARHAAILDEVAQAAELSLAPLEDMLARSGVDVDGMLSTLRREAAEGGEDAEMDATGPAGGPFIPVDAADEIVLTGQAAAVAAELERLALLTTAARRLPFAVPVRGPRFTSGFGVRRDPVNGRRSRHNGLDMAGPVGTPIYSPGEGVVTFVGWRRGYGRVVEIDHGFGVQTLYAHLSRFRVDRGARVTAGQRIADMGSSGRSTGSHLHYEIHIQGRPVDPRRFIEAARHVL